MNRMLRAAVPPRRAFRTGVHTVLSVAVLYLGKLVELYRQSRNDTLVAQTYSSMVEAYLAAGGLDQAASILEMLVQLEPHNDQHRSKLRWLREQLGDQPAAGFEVDFEKLPVPSPPASLEPPRRAGGPVGIELSGPLSADDEEFLSLEEKSVAGCAGRDAMAGQS